jgi:hypothetical protein
MLKPIDNVYSTTNKKTSELYNIFGDEMTFYQVLPFTDTNFGNYPISHSFADLNMFGESSYNIANKSMSEGGLLNSAFQSLPEAFWSNGMIIASFNNTTYREKFNGYNFGINIPLDSSYTGTTSGLTATTLYTAFIWDPSCLNINNGSLCAGAIQDSKISETNQTYTDGIGLGYKYIDGVNPKLPTDFFDSGIAYLFTDPIYQVFTGATGSSVSWSYNFGMENKYSKGARTVYPSLTQTQNNTYDLAVGMVNLTSGLVYIWDKNLVQGFNWSVFNGDQLTGATTTSGNTYAIVQDMDTEVLVNIDIIAKPGEWGSTTNPSAIGETCNTVATKVCLYDESNNLIGIATPSEAITIPTNNYTVLKLTAPISGAIDETGIWATRGVVLSL